MLRIVFTGGPSGGKTSIIEVLQRDFGPRVAAVPEAATILYQGGFPRRPGPKAMKCIQRAVYWVQGELESLAENTYRAPVMLLDRGSLDGVAYWPGEGSGFLRSVGSSFAREAGRYDIVLHLRTPRGRDYRSGGTRIESPREALRIDRRIEAAWSRHPRRFVIADEPDFLVKMQRVKEVLRREAPRLFGARKA